MNGTEDAPVLQARLPIVCTGNGRHPVRSLRWSVLWYDAAGVERMRLQTEVERDATRDVQELIKVDGFDGTGRRKIVQILCPRCGACKRVEWRRLFQTADALRQLGVDQLDIARLP